LQKQTLKTIKMKKVLLFVAVVAAISFVSCKKDRVCTCTTTTGGVSGTADVVTYTKSLKKDARLMCMSESGTSGGVAYTKTCTLK